MLAINSLKYKMLRLVFLQAALLGFVLASLWLINPRWVFWHQTNNPVVTESLKQFKHHYGMLNTLNLGIAKMRTNSHPTLAQIQHASTELNQHIQAIKNVSLTAQQHFKLDFTVLINFLFNYKNKIAQLDPSQPNYDDALWDTQLYFSRIQSEFFYIAEEIDRFDKENAAQELQNAQNSLLIWGLSNIMILAFGLIIALSYAQRWKNQINKILNQVYRISADDYSTNSDINPDDELGFLAKAFNEAVARLQHKNSTSSPKTP